jgi:hypothetical protein
MVSYGVPHFYVLKSIHHIRHTRGIGLIGIDCGVLNGVWRLLLGYSQRKGPKGRRYVLLGYGIAHLQFPVQKGQLIFRSNIEI